MTLEQAIEFCLHMEKEQYKSAHNTIIGDYPEYEAAPHFRLASEYKQIAEWLKDLKEAKRLLKLALEQTNPKCKYCIHDLEEEQPNYNPCCTGETANCKWRYADEALKLIGDNNR